MKTKKTKPKYSLKNKEGWITDIMGGGAWCDESYDDKENFSSLFGSSMDYAAKYGQSKSFDFCFYCDWFPSQELRIHPSTGSFAFSESPPPISI